MGRRALLLLSLLALAACGPIEAGRAVAVVADDETIAVIAKGLTVRDALIESGVSLDEDDRVEPLETSLLEEGMTIRVIRVQTDLEVEQLPIPFERQTVIDATIPSGETRLIEQGRTGIEELTYRTTYENGEPVDRTLVRRVITSEPRPEVLLVGGEVSLVPVVLDGTVASVAGRNAWLMRASSANRWRLTHTGDLDGQVFRLSPDGTHLLYTRATTSTTIADGDEDDGLPPFNTLWVIETSPGAFGPVQLPAENVLWADWEPSCGDWNMGNGCRIAYTTGVAAAGEPGWRAENDLWLAQPDPATGQLNDTQLAVEPSSGGAYGWWGTTFAWSPDGTRLSYARADEIGAVAVPTGTLTPLASFPPYRTYAHWVWTPVVSWSPDGTIIVAAVHSPAEGDSAPQESPVFHVFALATDGTLKATLVENAGMWAMPAFAAKGNTIVYGQAHDPRSTGVSRYHLRSMDRDGSDQRPLFPPPTELGMSFPEYAWAPSGEQVIAVYRGDLYLISALDGPTVPLTADGTSTLVDWR